MFATIALDVRTGPGEDCTSPKNELVTACASPDHFEEMELRELNMMRLPSCVMGVTVPGMECRETVLVSAHHKMGKQLPSSDHFFHAVQILDAAGVWTEAQGVRKQVVEAMSAVWLSVKIVRQNGEFRRMSMAKCFLKTSFSKRLSCWRQCTRQ